MIQPALVEAGHCLIQTVVINDRPRKKRDATTQECELHWHCMLITNPEQSHKLHAIQGLGLIKGLRFRDLLVAQLLSTA